MSVTGRLLRTAWKANRVERAVRNPARYVRNRAKSKVTPWGLWFRWWRA